MEKHVKYCELLHITALLHVAFIVSCHCNMLLVKQKDKDFTVV